MWACGDTRIDVGIEGLTNKYSYFHKHEIYEWMLFSPTYVGT